MRKLSFALTAFGALCAVFAMTASSAFAALKWEEVLPAEYLWNSAVIAEGAELPAVTEGEILLEDMKPSIGGAVDLLCSGKFDGVIMGPKDALITEVLNLAGTSKNIMCTFTTKGGCSGTEALVEGVNLPWLVEPMLWRDTETGEEVFVLLITSEVAGAQPGYKSECNSFIGKQTDTCTGNVGALGRNVAAGFEGEFLENDAEITPVGTCSSAGGEALLNGPGLTTDTAGGVLSLSSP